MFLLCFVVFFFLFLFFLAAIWFRGQKGRFPSCRLCCFIKNRKSVDESCPKLHLHSPLLFHPAGQDPPCHPVGSSVCAFDQVSGSDEQASWCDGLPESQCGIGQLEKKSEVSLGLFPFKSTSEQCNSWCPRKLSCCAQGVFPPSETSETVLHSMYVCLFNAYRCALFWESVSFKLKISS